MKDRLYFDYNSTALVLPKVRQALIEAIDVMGNPSSVHQIGRKARAFVDQSRRIIAEVVDASHKDITFTSGGTEANHLALSGLNFSKEYIYSAATDHASIYKNIIQDNLIPVAENGQLQLSVLEKAFERSNPPKLFSFSYANSETGILQEIQPILDLCHKHGCIVHLDAVQALGKIPLSFSNLEVDMMSISAHKIGGSKGVGALVSRSKLPLKAKYLGGGQEKGLRSGTENILGIMGFSAAASEISFENWIPVRRMLSALSEDMKAYAPIRINSVGECLPNTLNMSTPGFNKETQVIYFDLNNICLSAGAACSSGKVERSHVLQAMGIEEVYTDSAIRLSVAPTVTQEELNTFLLIWKAMIKEQKMAGNND